VADTSWYFPTPLNTTLNLRGKAGMIWAYGGRDVPIYEKFFVGGAQTIRGFEYGMAGPVDKLTDDPLGANKMVIFTAELVFPLAREIGLRGALFFDIGKGWGTDPGEVDVRKRGIAMGVGPGIRWLSPFGPINIDIGFNLNPKKGEKRHVIDFNAGTVY
jgi:outer membrane protein insertion porin family